MAYKVPPPKLYDSFVADLPAQDGKVVVITGTTSGTGFVAAKTSLSKGATTVMLNRESSRAETAVEKLKKEFPEAEDKIISIPCDLQKFESVEKAADEVSNRFPDGIDILCNNAGVMALADKATGDGYDVQMQTNHLSHFLLTKKLMPLLEKSAEKGGDARVVNHTSVSRLYPFSSLNKKYFGKNGGNLGGNSNSMYFGGARWERYHQSKLANSVFTIELAERLKKAGSKVRSFCAHPGLAATELQNTTLKDDGVPSVGFMSNAQAPADGALGIIKCMFSNNVENGSLYGPRFTAGLPGKRWHGILSSASAGKMLWEESEKACGAFNV